MSDCSVTLGQGYERFIGNQKCTKAWLNAIILLLPILKLSTSCWTKPKLWVLLTYTEKYFWILRLTDSPDLIVNVNKKLSMELRYNAISIQEYFIIILVCLCVFNDFPYNIIY